MKQAVDRHSTSHHRGRQRLKEPIAPPTGATLKGERSHTHDRQGCKSFEQRHRPAAAPQESPRRSSTQGPGQERKGDLGRGCAHSQEHQQVIHPHQGVGQTVEGAAGGRAVGLGGQGSQSQGSESGQQGEREEEAFHGRFRSAPRGEEGTTEECSD